MAGQTARPRFEMRLPAKGRVEERAGEPAMVARSAARRRQDAATARR
jgi:hypothetical protein